MKSTMLRKSYKLLEKIADWLLALTYSSPIAIVSFTHITAEVKKYYAIAMPFAMDSDRQSQGAV